MLSFDVSAIDMVLVLAVIILLFLYASKKSNNSTNERLHAPTIEKPRAFSIQKPYESSMEKPRALPIEKTSSLAVARSHVPAIKSQLEERKLVQEKYGMNKTLEVRNVVMQPQATSQNCAHNFGYLGNLPKHTPIPDECLSCPNVMKCLSQKKSL